MAKRGSTNLIFLFLMATCCLISISINFLHEKVTNEANEHSVFNNPAEVFRRQHLSIDENKNAIKRELVDGEHPVVKSPTGREQVENEAVGEILDEEDNDGQHKIAGLSCSKYGGPSEEIAQEMVYWSDIPSDSKYVSPFKKAKGEEVRYMTFEPDGGGWNNIRMAMETVVAMAHAMGRTLVMPPEQGMYLLRKDRKKQKTDFSFADFFPFQALATEHDGVEIITTEEFLKREAITGHLFNKTSGEVSFPPHNRTDWNGQDVKELKEWLREVTHTPIWKPDKCMAAFPQSADPKEVSTLQKAIDEIVKEGFLARHVEYEKPVGVDAPVVDRMKEMISGRRDLCVYDEEMQKAHVIHFMCYHKLRVRLLVHFYAFLFFEDWKQDLWTKRFIRDHVRYIDEIQCAAARVVHAVRERARKKDPSGNPDGLFDSFHIRRGDFQYKETRVEADVIYENSKDELTEGATVFIATDERKKDFFKPLADHYDICFLDDFKHLFKGLNTNYYGMLDQLIASKGRIFFGTWFSTFTGYINRMRGYHVSKQKLEGYEDGTMQSYYFIPKPKKFAMRKYAGVKRSFFAREFPTSWRDLDKGIGELHTDGEASRQS